MGEWPVAGGVFRTRIKGPKRESRGGIFHRYPPHEPAQAIVLACILRHVDATRDDIAHRKLPRWYEPSFYCRTLRCGLRAPESLMHGHPWPSFNQWLRLRKGYRRLAAKLRARSHTVPNPERETWKLHPEYILSEYAATSRFNPVRILQNV